MVNGYNHYNRCPNGASERTIFLSNLDSVLGWEIDHGVEESLTALQAALRIKSRLEGLGIYSPYDYTPEELPQPLFPTLDSRAIHLENFNILYDYWVQAVNDPRWFFDFTRIVEKAIPGFEEVSGVTTLIPYRGKYGEEITFTPFGYPSGAGILVLPHDGVRISVQPRVLQATAGIQSQVSIDTWDLKQPDVVNNLNVIIPQVNLES